MVTLLIASALATDVPVGFPLGADRYVASVITSDWTASVDAPERKCWTRGPAELCLAATTVDGKTPSALIEAEKARYTVASCENVPQPASAAAATAQCLVREGLQDQNRYWSVIVDGPQAVWVTVRFAGSDDAAQTDAGAFVTKFGYASPILLTTLGVPACSALRQALAASVDQFAPLRGGPSDPPNKSTLAWPGALTNEIATTGTQVSYHATIALRRDPNEALAETKTFIDSLGACDSWCAPMASTDEATPQQRVVTLTPQVASAAPRCAATKARIVVSQNAIGLFDVSFWVDAP